MMESPSLEPIGIFHCPQTSPQESPRQGVLAPGSNGVLKLHSSIPEESLRDLDGIERIWLVYRFHKNTSWKPLVQPPRGGDQKRGVFATRSPYRPNSIGISCVRLGEIRGREIKILEHDLIDGTPVYDIKPYLPYSDSFPDAKIGWLENLKPFAVLCEETANKKINWLSEKLRINLQDILRNQLEFEPINHKKKRVKAKKESWELSYKTWRIQFSFNNEVVHITNLCSGYSLQELEQDDNLYGDKDFHREFNAFFKEKVLP